VADRQWRRALTRPTKRPTQTEAPRQAVFDDDTRLSDARTPTAHNHTATDISDGASTYVTVADFTTWVNRLRDDNAGAISVPDYPL